MTNRIGILVLLFVTISVNGCFNRTLPNQDRELLNRVVIERTQTNATLHISRPPRNAYLGFVEGLMVGLIVGGVSIPGVGVVVAPFMAVDVAKGTVDPKIVDQFFIPALQMILDPTKLQNKLEEEIVKTAAARGVPLQVFEPKTNLGADVTLGGASNAPVLTAQITLVQFIETYPPNNMVRLRVEVGLKKGSKQLVEADYCFDGHEHRFSDLLQDNNLTALSDEVNDGLKELATAIFEEQFFNFRYTSDVKFGRIGPC